MIYETHLPVPLELPKVITCRYFKNVASITNNSNKKGNLDEMITHSCASIEIH